MSDSKRELTLTDAAQQLRRVLDEYVCPGKEHNANLLCLQLLVKAASAGLDVPEDTEEG